jgi:hypothetical protein
MKYLTAIFLFLLGACDASSDSVVTLYKKGLEKTERIHVATFDAVSGAESNQMSCAAISVLLEKQDAMNRYWCEKGYYDANKVKLSDD